MECQVCRIPAIEHVFSSFKFYACPKCKQEVGGKMPQAQEVPAPMPVLESRRPMKGDVVKYTGPTLPSVGVCQGFIYSVVDEALVCTSTRSEYLYLLLGVPSWWLTEAELTVVKKS